MWTVFIMAVAGGGLFVAWMLVKAGDDFDNTFEDDTEGGA